MMPYDADTDLSDDALMVLFANGDEQAAVHLTHRHTGRVLALARRMLGDGAEAEDVTQEAMLRLWRIAPDWRQGQAKVSTWLYRVTANLSTDRLRRRKGSDPDALADLRDETPSAETQLIARDRLDALQHAIAALPERQRLAMSLKYFHDLSNPEVAEVMDTTVEAVESLLARGKRTLAQSLADRRDELGL